MPRHSVPESDKRGQRRRVVRRSFGQHVNGWIDAQPGDYVYLLWSRPDSFGGRWTYWVLVTNLRFAGR
jgi:hypothetical protein